MTRTKTLAVAKRIAEEIGDSSCHCCTHRGICQYEDNWDQSVSYFARIAGDIADLRDVIALAFGHHCIRFVYEKPKEKELDERTADQAR